MQPNANIPVSLIVVLHLWNNKELEKEMKKEIQGVLLLDLVKKNVLVFVMIYESMKGWYIIN